MSDGRLFLLMIGLLVVVTGLVVVAAAVIARVVAARRHKQVAILDDGSDRPIYDIPVVFHPRGTLARSATGPRADVPRDDPPLHPSSQESPPAHREPEARRAASVDNGARWEFVAPEVISADATVQFLPGRLEPLNSGELQEIRFVRLKHVTRFTFGRSSGPEYQHIQLSAPTASRMHGYMVYEGGRWRIGNLSETNPVVVNGTPLTEQHDDKLLEDGDRIEFGEVGFRFRER